MDPLASPAELQDHLQHPVDTPVAELALELASGAVRGYCGWNLSRETTTFYIEGDGRKLMSLPTLELISVAEVRRDGDTLVDPPIKWSRKGQGWADGLWTDKAQFEFDVEHGYDPLPDTLKLVALDLAASQLNNPMGLSSATTGQVTRTWTTSSANAGAMNLLHQRLLDPYSL